MEILKRSGGGRGEYELAGTDGSLTPQDLVGRELVIKLITPYPSLPTGIVAKKQGGKCRLRRDPRGRQIHVQRQIESLLLLPKSIREEGKLTGGEPTILENRYVLRRIGIEDIQRSSTRAVLSLGGLECDNRSMQAELNFVERLSRIKRLHENAAAFPAEVRELIEKHRDLLAAARPLERQAEQVVERIMEEIRERAVDYDVEYIYGTDVLTVLEEILDLPHYEQPPSVDAIDPQDVDLKRREAAKWRRWAASRGAIAAQFRRSVRKAYAFQCVICGLQLPRNDACPIAGVDAAHILPWAEYELDVVSNGLCLCKLHHWAFDQFLLAIIPRGKDLHVVMTKIAKKALKDAPSSLAELRKLEGPIPAERLPRLRANWPSKQFLSKLYEQMDLID